MEWEIRKIELIFKKEATISIIVVVKIFSIDVI